MLATGVYLFGHLSKTFDDFKIPHAFVCNRMFYAESGGKFYSRDTID